MSKHPMPATIRVLNIDVYNTDLASFLVEWEEGCVFTPNIDHFVLLQQQREFYDAYRATDHIVLDSQVVRLLWKFRKVPFRGTVSGSDLFPAFCRHHAQNDAVTIFLLGGAPGAAARVRDDVNAAAGREMVVGVECPPLDFEKDERVCSGILERIAASKATMLAVALGTPKQELWLHRHRSSLTQVRYLIGIGATLDFMAGIVTRAPRWMRSAGLEWLFRLVRDPRRMAPRYLLRDILFFYYLMLDILHRYKDPFQQGSARS